MGFTHAYGTAMDDREASRAIAEALDMGYTFFDTVECYIGNRADGSTACNEELVGAALKLCRDKAVIASKCGVHHSPEGNLVMDSRPEIIRRSVEGSLKRLQTDRIDLYYQHRIDPKIPAEDVAGVMADLIREGKILHWGVSETDETYLRKAHAVCPVTCVQNRYSIMARGYEKLFPVLEEPGVGYVAFSPLANGFLSGAYGKDSKFEASDFRSFMPQYRAEAIDANQALTDYIKALAEEKQAIRMAKTLVNEATSEQIRSAPVFSLYRASMQDDFRMMMDLIQKGARPGEYARQILQPLTYENRNSWQAEEYLKAGMRIEPDD